MSDNQSNCEKDSDGNNCDSTEEIIHKDAVGNTEEEAQTSEDEE